jgi:D-glycero-D-manno-heptose 1,7-bisphosphate phosphatase
MAGRGAVFLDRDGTIIEDPGYLADPARVVLLPRAAEGLAALAKAGWPLVMVSNQSGIARGLLTEADYHAVNRRLEELLAPSVRFLASYFCPHHPAFTGPCGCRKPGLDLYRRAEAEHGLDLAASWYVGDKWSDAAPALAVGGRGLVLASDGLGEAASAAARHGVALARHLAEAASLIGSPVA